MNQINHSDDTVKPDKEETEKNQNNLRHDAVKPDKMDKMDIEEICKRIETRDASAEDLARKHWMSVGKPLFSLGKLEDAIIQIAGIKGTPDYHLAKKGLVIMCADNGVVEEGVTQTGQEVTAVVAENFTRDMASVCLMSQVAGVHVYPVDIGIAADVPALTKSERKVAYGTRNFAKEPAMTKEEVRKAIAVGIRMVSELKEQGYDILATGEMGIGNTTTSSAVASVLLGVRVEDITGKGAGLDSEGLKRKIGVIREAIRKYEPDPEDVIDVLSKVGGLDIAGLAGVFLGGALYKIPVVIDGLISSVAALCAVRITEKARDYMLPSHVSGEPGGRIILDALELAPFLTCGMFLGEGSGAVALMPLLDMALRVYREMGTFEDIQIEKYEILN